MVSSLTQIIIGSEGTLGIITKIVFRLIPLPTKDITMLVPFNSSEKACEAVSDVDLIQLDEKKLDLMISSIDFDEK